MAQALTALAVAAADVETHTKAFLALESADGKISGNAPHPREVYAHVSPRNQRSKNKFVFLCTVRQSPHPTCGTIDLRVAACGLQVPEHGSCGGNLGLTMPCCRRSGAAPTSTRTAN